MRSDAAERRARIIRAARHLFAAEGGEVALEAVADAAGVGIATLYRNFASRSALADEVVLAILLDMRAAAAEALADLETDPAQAWTRYVGRLADLDLGAVSAALTEHVTRDLAAPVREAQEQTLAGVEGVLAAGRRAGLVRDDVAALELVLALGLVTRPLPEAIRDAAPDLVPRLLATLLAGMTPGPRPAWLESWSPEPTGAVPPGT
ncbi:TetR/AcrR family transcriptional regulator [Nocardioides sp. zg-1228]|uniref:TetR/AcrR family transcriptional regulator n=1 Tax=Nocardioides sp. zg-1228 TaxID=2763008 RepID=UPI001642C4D2|nr:TetR/AcrR family transcriptional regulator [Nocardioides sp. zg-1228]MBC2932082.1 TetR/AcrR family transcriptional regulator [Nocardioides sp. zg-1228]QSF57630.1 TetR/AcrR family transcriptional regulator [Nocardioides sp. zg-1228]